MLTCSHRNPSALGQLVLDARDTVHGVILSTYGNDARTTLMMCSVLVQSLGFFLLPASVALMLLLGIVSTCVGFGSLTWIGMAVLTCGITLIGVSYACQLLIAASAVVHLVVRQLRAAV